LRTIFNRIFNRALKGGGMSVEDD